MFFFTLSKLDWCNSKVTNNNNSKATDNNNRHIENRQGINSVHRYKLNVSKVANRAGENKSEEPRKRSLYASRGESSEKQNNFPTGLWDGSGSGSTSHRGCTAVPSSEIPPPPCFFQYLCLPCVAKDTSHSHLYRKRELYYV